MPDTADWVDHEPEVYGISFPKSMLPLTDGSVSMSGTWTADVLLDANGDEQDVPYVRVWLYAPAPYINPYRPNPEGPSGYEEAQPDPTECLRKDCVCR